MKLKGLQGRIVVFFAALMLLAQLSVVALTDNQPRWLPAVSPLALLIALIAGIVEARSIARSLRELAAFARRVAKGEYLPAPSNLVRYGEIGDLSAALLGMSEDVAAREAEISRFAYRDTLTGLPNRTLFNERLQHGIALSRRTRQSFSVLVIDLDQFKEVNDTLGHHVGDLLLCEVAERLQKSLRRQSDTVARLGGDEFAILLATEDAPGAQTIAREILAAVDEQMSLEGHLVDVRASIGIAIWPQHGDDPSSLLRSADVAMYAAKRGNAGFAVYDSRFDRPGMERQSLMGELRQAVDRGELVLLYQPKVSLGGLGGKSVEALVRWRHPQRGMIRPAEFVSSAEQTGHIKLVTHWVLNAAVRQCAEWRRTGLPINVSINISARDLASPELLQSFSAMLMAHACEAGWVGLEVAESAVAERPRQALAHLDRWRSLGCRLSIDDYGTSCSSLAYLKRLGIGELKIDRSFVNGMVHNLNDEQIVRSTIDLAHHLGLKVVAEGVETAATLRRLEDLRCDMAQGFFLSEPLHAEQIPEWMRDSPWVADAAPSVCGTANQTVDEGTLALGGSC